MKAMKYCVMIGAILGTSVLVRADAASTNTVLSCKKVDGHERFGLKIDQTADGKYQYSARECYSTFSDCDGAPLYESSGEIERISSNGPHSLFFKNSDISIFPICGQMLNLADHKERPGEFFFFFDLRESSGECEFHLTDGELL